MGHGLDHGQQTRHPKVCQDGNQRKLARSLTRSWHRDLIYDDKNRYNIYAVNTTTALLLSDHPTHFASKRRRVASVLRTWCLRLSPESQPMMCSSVASAASSSPPTPLPISVGPGLERYAFTPSPSPSPPFSSAGASSPLLRVVRSEPNLLMMHLCSALSVDKIHREPPPRRPTKPRLDLRTCW